MYMLLYLLTKSLSIYIHIDTYYIYILKEDIYILLKLKNYFYHDYINNEYEYYETRSCIPRRSMHSVPTDATMVARMLSRAPARAIFSAIVLDRSENMYVPRGAFTRACLP